VELVYCRLKSSVTRLIALLISQWHKFFSMHVLLNVPHIEKKFESEAWVLTSTVLYIMNYFWREDNSGLTVAIVQ
jgi:hypothetical protein